MFTVSGQGMPPLGTTRKGKQLFSVVPKKEDVRISFSKREDTGLSEHSAVCCDFFVSIHLFIRTVVLNLFLSMDPISSMGTAVDPSLKINQSKEPR